MNRVLAHFRSVYSRKKRISSIKGYLLFGSILLALVIIADGYLLFSNQKERTAQNILKDKELIIELVKAKRNRELLPDFYQQEKQKQDSYLYRRNVEEFYVAVFVGAIILFSLLISYIRLCEQGFQKGKRINQVLSLHTMIITGTLFLCGLGGVLFFTLFRKGAF